MRVERTSPGTIDGTTIDVVIPYFDGRERLASILLALSAQIDHVSDARLDGLRIVVADDASTVEPDTSMSRHPVQVVRLDRPGFHAATARNVGATNGQSPIIVFLDGDTVPAPTCISMLVEPIRDLSADVTTGHRSHADFSGLDPSEVASFVASPDRARLLAEPAWLRDGLERTDRLRTGTSQIYQYVISAVMAMRRDLFSHIGGFDDRFDTYGGEDWELAYRCWNAGAEFQQVDDAIAFHDGPDIERRDLDRQAKTIESLRIAELVPASATRLPGVNYAVPDIEVEVDLRPGHPVCNAMCVVSLLASVPGDLHLRLTGPAADVDLLLDLVSDQRLAEREEESPTGARCIVSISAPVVFDPTALDDISRDVRDGLRPERCLEVSGSRITVRSVRLHGPFSRALPNPSETPGAAIDCESVVAGSDLGITVCGATDLAEWMRHRARSPR